MTEKELLAEIAAELGIDPAHPDIDQLDAAVAETTARARKLAKVGAPDAVMFRIAAHDLVPPMVVRWLQTYTDAFAYDGRVCNPAHVGLGTPTTLYAVTPNRRLCDPCAGWRAHELARDAVRQRRPGDADALVADCDFCGVPADLLKLRAVFLPVVSVLVRAFGCARCLSHSTVPA